jgi:hypothetical protein
MRNSSIILIDYLNLGLLLILLKLKFDDEIYVIFHNNNSYIESILLKWLFIKGVRVNFKKLNSKKTYLGHTMLADKISQSYIDNLSINNLNERYLINRIGKFCYARIYRTASIIEFVNGSLDLHEIKSIFLSSPKFNTKFDQNVFKNNVNFYNSIGYPIDSTCQDPFRPYTLNSYHRKLLTILTLIKRIFLLIPLSWPNISNLKAIFHVHPQTPERHFFQQKEVTEIKNSCVLDNSLNIKLNGKSYSCRRLPLKRLFSYIFHLYQFRFLAKKAVCLPFIDKLNLFIEWTDIFFLTEMVEFFNPKIFYSNYESSIALQMQSILKNYDCISSASTYSAGYLAVKYEFTHQLKFADIFFVWGESLSSLYFNSGDMSNQHLITGYTGDCFREEFAREANNRFNGKKSSIIAVYDNTYNDDLFLDFDETLLFIEKVTRHCIKHNAHVVIKTKKNKSMYANLLDEFPGYVDIVSKHASLAASMNADLVVGYLSSSPVMVSAAWGINTVFFDPYNFVWKEGQELLNENLVNKIEDLYLIIDRTIQGKNISENSTKLKEIDPFSDGHATKRISEYLNDILLKETENKAESILYANNNYAANYGHEFIIHNPKAN